VRWALAGVKVAKKFAPEIKVPAQKIHNCALNLLKRFW
jgi:hypothetical protein